MQKVYGAILFLFFTVCIFSINGCTSPKEEISFLDDRVAIGISSVYSSFSEMAKDADFIGIVKAEKEFNPKESTSRQMEFHCSVEKSYYSSDEQREIVVTMAGTKEPGNRSEYREDPLMEVGKQYLLFAQKKEDPQGNYESLVYTNGRYLYEDKTFTSLNHLYPDRFPDGLLSPSLDYEKEPIETVEWEIQSVEKVAEYLQKVH